MNNCRCRSLRTLFIEIRTFDNKVLRYRCSCIRLGFKNGCTTLELVFLHRNKPTTSIYFLYRNIYSFEIMDFYRRDTYGCI